MTAVAAGMPSTPVCKFPIPPRATTAVIEIWGGADGVRIYYVDRIEASATELALHIEGVS